MAAFDRTQWELTVIASALPPGAKTTALALATQADPESGRAFPGERALAAISRQSRTAVWNHLRRLAGAGLIERDPDVNALTGAAGYRLVIPELAP